MATNKTTEKFYMTVDGEEVLITNAKMMEMAIAALEEVNADSAVIGKAKQHLATMKKPAAGKTSETAIKNAEDAQKLLALLPSEPFTLDFVASKMGYITPTTGKANTQKAYKVVEILIKANRVVKVATKSSEASKYQLL